MGLLLAIMVRFVFLWFVSVSVFSKFGWGYVAGTRVDS